MRGIVVGLGSMGKRRIRLMKAFFPRVELCGVDSSAERRSEAESLFGIPCFAKIGEAARCFSPSIGFVCTSPLSHADIINELLTMGLGVFTEINLVSDRYAENIALAEKKGLLLFLSSTPLYRNEIKYITRAVSDAGCPISYRYHVGQYLPDWHPWESYKDFFVGDKRTNGCREIFAIELPWLEKAFGEIKDFTVEKSKQTTLTIDYPDSYMVTLKHKTGTVGQLAVNVVSRKAVRDLEVIGEKLYLRWGGSPDSLSVYDPESRADIRVDTYESVTRDARYASNIIENAYVDELKAFFDALEGREAVRHSFSEDERLLSIIDKIEG